MRPTRLTTKLTVSAALVLAVALGAGPARAADDDVPLDTKLLRGLMEGLGLKRDGEGINYQERAPLVIPPGKDLPPPERSGAAVANNPAWPKDPDIARAREMERLERNRNVSAEREIEQNPLRPAQMTPGGNPRTPPSRRRTSANLGENGERMTPAELGFKGSLFGAMFGGGKDDESGRFTGEPARSSLTEPPPGYQTPSPDQPYGAGKAAAPKATDYFGTKGEATR